MYPGGDNEDRDGLAYTASLVSVLRAERESRGWTAVRLGEESGVHRSVISRAEKGERYPGVPVIVRLCRAMDVPLSEVCRRAEIRPPEDCQA